MIMSEQSSLEALNYVNWINYMMGFSRIFFSLSSHSRFLLLLSLRFQMFSSFCFHIKVYLWCMARRGRVKKKTARRDFLNENYDSTFIFIPSPHFSEILSILKFWCDHKKNFLTLFFALFSSGFSVMIQTVRLFVRNRKR